ncbi:MAG: hypothetical protein ACTHMQ_00950 [Protaetiibacter sp.]
MPPRTGPRRQQLPSESRGPLLHTRAPAGLPEPELDAGIRNGYGRLLGIADGRYRGYRVLIEVEGDHHRTDRPQWARDIEKHAAYAAEGHETVRLTGIQIRQHPEQGVALIRNALIRGGWLPDRR